MDLSERKKQILRSVIDAYIRTGEPVGSKSLSEDLGCSSATVRNEMSELETLGLLTHPHTSAGRVPSDEGYREYVANLMARYRLSVDEIAILDSLLDDKLAEFQETLEEACRLLSHLTKYAAVSLAATEQGGSLKKIDCIYVNEYSFLIAVIFQDSTTKTHQEQTDFPISEANLSLATELCNRQFAMRDCRDILAYLSSPKGSNVPSLVGAVYHALFRVLSTQKKYRVDVSGLSNLLQYPEFSDLDRTREVLRVLEEKERLVRHLTGLHQGETSISIGALGAQSMKDTSMIVRTFRIGDDVVGALGIIGPKRMEYSGTLARLEYLARRILPSGTNREEEEL